MTNATSDSRRPVLVVVHPDSACGSATYNLGRQQANADREALIADINRWVGDVLVIIGGFEEELATYPALARSLADLLARAKAAKSICERVRAPDPTQGRAVLRFVKKHRLTPDSVRFEVTGAWATESGEFGCVNDVQQHLAKAGYAVHLRDQSAVYDAEDRPEPIRWGNHC